jgi:hypothetical protein
MGAVGAALLLMLTAAGCGDDDDNIDSGLDGGGSGGADGGATKDGGMTGSGGSTMTGGSGGATIPPGNCDKSIPTTATCGGTACPAVAGALAGFICAVPCCLPDDTCGTRRATMGAPTDCAPPATEDPACPHYVGMVMGMMTDLVGCCAPSGKCGAISTTDMSCITSSPILPDLKPGAACAGAGDGGTESDGG